jgi:hypothetical protein
MFRLRRPQFALRTLVALVTLAAIGLGLWSAYVEPYRREAKVAAYVASLGGHVTMEPAGPELLRRVFGDEHFSVVTAVDLRPDWAVWDREKPKAAATGMRFSSFRALAHLRKCDLSYTEVADKDLSQLAHCVGLEDLRLDGTAVSDAGLAHLSGLPMIKLLCLNQTQVTARGLRTFRASHPQLWIQSCRIDCLSAVKDREAPLEPRTYRAAFRLVNLSPCSALYYGDLARPIRDPQVQHSRGVRGGYGSAMGFHYYPQAKLAADVSIDGTVTVVNTRTFMPGPVETVSVEAMLVAPGEPNSGSAVWIKSDAIPVAPSADAPAR